MDLLVKPMDNEQLDIIEKILDQALEFGLEVETIYWALKKMQEDPSMTPGEAMAFGIIEWVK